MKNIVLSLALAIASLTYFSFASATSPALPSVRIPILVYHHIRATKPYPTWTWSYKMSVSAPVFEKQMQWIADHGYTTVSLDDALAILKGERTDIAKPVVVTFDDNNLTAYDVGLPVLQKHGFVAVFYIVSNRLKNTATIDAVRVKKLSEMGMDIESHTVTHSTLTALSLKRLGQELIDSKRVLEELTGKPVRHIAYPSTAHNKTVRAHAATAGYVTGTIMDPRVATGNDDVMKLPRIMMTDETRLERVLP